MSGLEHFSDNDLRLELSERQERARLAAEERRQEFAISVGRHIDALLSLVPDHNRRSCSDALPSNADSARCTRCVLLYTKETGFLPAEFELSIEVTTRPEAP